ncbi:MAG: hypothetical protein M0Q92_14905 [Methanoregula sp.]|nr:hypothetical protein [Methanoregula sp.]
MLNFKRLSKYGFVFDNPIKPPDIFRWMQKAGDISHEKMYRTFYMGMGYAYVVPDQSVACIPGRVAQVVKEPRARGGEVGDRCPSGPVLIVRRGEVGGPPGDAFRDLEFIYVP